MNTAYIGKPLKVERPSGQTYKGELRVDSSEAWEGRMSVGVYGFESGNEFVTAHLSRTDVEELRAACDAFLTPAPAPAPAPSP